MLTFAISASTSLEIAFFDIVAFCAFGVIVVHLRIFGVPRALFSHDFPFL